MPPELLEDWESLVESAWETRDQLVRLYRNLETRARRQPLGAMAWAVAAGFILGGGLFSRLTTRIARVAATTMVRAGCAGLLARGLVEIAPWIEPPPVATGTAT